ncbi:MAG: D-aminoacyl-tRNA deacylase [Neptuniibacter sp.]
MKALIQRVKSASVEVNNKRVGEINQGILLLLGVEKDDSEIQADKLLKKILGYRIFADEEGKMNNNLLQVNGGLLIVSQFTLVAETNKGLRPGFSLGATPELGERLYDYFTAKAKENHDQVETGIFAADMQVNLINDGPVTFWLES